MRRSYSLLFLLIMLLSTVGYFQFLVAIEQKVSSGVIRRIINNENEISGNVVLRVPVSLPYPSDDDEYKSASGEITIEGVLYRFVKEKMYRDTLYLVCSNDKATAEARNAISDYSASFAETHHQKADAPKKGAASFLPAFYISNDFSSTPDPMSCVIDLRQEIPKNLYQFSSIWPVFHPPC